MTRVALMAAVAAATAAIDVGAKGLVVGHLTEGRLYGAGGWGLRWARNARGAVLALPLRSTVALWAVLSAGLGWTVAAQARSVSPLAAAGFGLALGGAAGNLVDRMRSGGVVDYVAAGRWPVFNLADAAMVLGIVFAVGAVL